MNLQNQKLVIVETEVRDGIKVLQTRRDDEADLASD